MKDYIKMPWKNGLGSTLQIAVDQNSLWRLSAATVLQPSPFSDYTGYDRRLTVWRGEGLMLNDFLLKKNEVYSFAGEEAIFCKNLSPEVTDLGLVFQRNQVRAEMNIHTVIDQITIPLRKGIHFIFCLEGEFTAQNLVMNCGDTLRLDIVEAAQISIDSKAAQLAMIYIDIN